MLEGRKPEYPEKAPDDKLQHMNWSVFNINYHLTITIWLKIVPIKHISKANQYKAALLLQNKLGSDTFVVAKYNFLVLHTDPAALLTKKSANAFM